MSEKVKVGIYLKTEVKENLNRLKEFDRNTNRTLDTILSFNKEGLIEYIKLCSLFQEKKEWELKTDEIYCTTIQKELKIKKALGSVSLNTVHRMILDTKLPLLAKGETEKEDRVDEILDRMVRLTKATEFLIQNEKRHDTEIEKLEKKILELEKNTLQK
jgi:hypothetical protein